MFFLSPSFHWPTASSRVTRHNTRASARVASVFVKTAGERSVPRAIAAGSRLLVSLRAGKASARKLDPCIIFNRPKDLTTSSRPPPFQILSSSSSFSSSSSPPVLVEGGTFPRDKGGMTRSQRPVKRWSRPDNAGSRRWRRCSRRRRRRTGNGSLPSGRRGTPLPAAAVKRQYRSRAAKESCRQVPLRGRGGEVHSGAVSVFAVWWRKLLLALHLTRIKINLAISIPSRTEEEESVLIPSSSIALRLKDSVGESSPLSIPRKIIPEIHGDHPTHRKLSRARGSLYKASLYAITFPPPSSLVHGEELNFMPERFIYRCWSVSSSIIRFETISRGGDRGNVRNSWQQRKKERKKGNEGRRRNIYLICKKFINLLVYEDEKTNKKKS